MKRTSARIFTLTFCLAAAAAPQKDYTKESPEQRARRMAWFNDARFGRFIHWGRLPKAALALIFADAWHNAFAAVSWRESARSKWIFSFPCPI